IYIGDSALNPPAGGTFATRQLYMSGNAVLQAARELRDRMAPVAADLLGVPPDGLEFATGRVWPAGAAGAAGGGDGRGGDGGGGDGNGGDGGGGDGGGVSVTLAELAAACEQRSISTAHLST